MNKTAAIAAHASLPTGPGAENLAPVIGKPTALVLEDIRHAYGRVMAVDGVSLSLAEGEVLALVGHSGSGKSTLLRVIAGLERPLGGRVTIAGRLVAGPGTAVSPEHRGVGFMFQDYALFPHMTVIGNVMFGLRKVPPGEREGIARDMLDRVGLAAFAGNYPHTLSGGEQQRVALARALAPRPSILLMDEPFSNLDRSTRDIVRDETIAIIRATGATAILVTHDPEDAMRTADRIVLMQSGRMVQAGTAEDLYRRPASLVVARFFSEFNEIDGVCRDGWVTTPVGAFRAAGLAEGARAVVCLRPGDIRRAGGAVGGIEGRVLSRRFLGATVLSSVEVRGVPRPLQVKGDLGHPAAGETVRLDFPTEDAFVFPAAATAPAPTRR
jgi:iron(III) transport system ATP-binding protein